MRDRRADRLAALCAALETLQLDGVLLNSPPNIRYLTGFSGSSALVFVTVRGDVVFVTDFRYQTQVADEVGDIARILIEPQSLWTGLWQALPDYAYVEVAGFESAHLLHRDFQRLLDAGARWQWRPSVDVVEGLRERKDPDEVAAITDAAGVATRALERTLPAVRVGMTELEVAGVLERALRDEGSEAFPFPSIVASGARSALPHAGSSPKAIVRGDFLLLDFGAATRGYCADVTRTIVVGTADGQQREVYEIVQSANATASANVRAGLRGKDADALARDYIERRGYGEAFGHSLGHGLGLEVHEAPRLARTADGVLAVGAVVTIEPGIYRPGWGGVRIEDDVHLGAAGPAVLTHFTRDLLEVA
ncbi:MAG TPA: Xaa-Pro peptidase family protein [Gemmatimonadaceae bacterium]|jgi:Xaa-Pro aminopeptidase|nr:Xaa-Pro peptidase family protein [Gemmatimonadaceae bacterium]